jgi:hypothetical protein
MMTTRLNPDTRGKTSNIRKWPRRDNSIQGLDNGMPSQESLDPRQSCQFILVNAFSVFVVCSNPP